MKADDAKALLLDHAAEELDGPVTAAARALVEGRGTADDVRAAMRDATAELAREAGPVSFALVIEGSAPLPCCVIEPPFVPTPPAPAPPPQDWPHAGIVRRSIAGDDDDAMPRLPSLRGFLAAAAASDDWGVPVRSTSDPERFGKGALRGGGGRPHDPCTGREHYALAQRELARVASSLSSLYGLDAGEQMAVWCTVAGAGRIEMRNIHTGGGTDAIARDEARAAKRSKRRRRGTMQPPGKRRAFLVPERKTLTATQVALELRRFDVFVTPHQVGLICRRVTERVRAAFERKGWIAKRDVKPDNVTIEEGSTMAAPHGFDLEGWKDILPLIGVSQEMARELMRRADDPLPVRPWFGRVIAVRAELLAWVQRQTAMSRTA